MLEAPEGLSACEALAYWRSMSNYAREQAEEVMELAALEYAALGGTVVDTIYGRIVTAQSVSYTYSSKVTRLAMLLDEQRRIEREEGAAKQVQTTHLRVIESTRFDE